MSEREKGAQDWFRKGTEAMNHKNWDYAIECFTNCVRLMPEHLLYRQSKHGCLRKLYNDNGSGAKMAGMRLMGVSEVDDSLELAMVPLGSCVRATRPPCAPVETGQGASGFPSTVRHPNVAPNCIHAGKRSSPVTR